jgi:protein gp37
MGDKSAIQWTEATWNPTTGCDRISPGCDHCYALTMAKRLKAMGQAKYQNDGDPRTSGPGFGLTVHPDTLSTPLDWRKPRMVFVNSMSDLFHARVPDLFVGGVWNTMALTQRHTYQILTKRSPRMKRLLTKWQDAGWYWRKEDMIWCGPVGPLPNVWLGASIEEDEYARRADDLRETTAAVRFLSLEPLIGPLPSLSFEGIDWTIIGGESGADARPLDLGWVRDLAGRAREAGSAVFVKQMGACWAREHGADSHGGDWSFWPEDLRIRQFPESAKVGAA